MIETWETIKKERKEGYDHRKPNKRVKKPKPIKNIIKHEPEENKDKQSIIHFQHDIPENDTDISSDNFNFSYLNQKNDKKVVIKINTEKLWVRKNNKL